MYVVLFVGCCDELCWVVEVVVLDEFNDWVWWVVFGEKGGFGNLGCLVMDGCIVFEIVVLVCECCVGEDCGYLICCDFFFVYLLC